MPMARRSTLTPRPPRPPAGASRKTGRAGFFDTSVPASHLYVYRRFAFDANQTYHFGGLTVDNNGLVQLGGGSELRLDGDLTIHSGSTVRVLGTDAGGSSFGQWLGRGGVLRAENMIVQAGASLTADAQGYLGRYDTAGLGPGAGPGNAGGTHAGIGGNSSGAAWEIPASRNTYGDPLLPADLGSSGGGFDRLGGGWGGNGGGAIQVVVRDTLTVDGAVSADGQSMNGTRGDGAGAGGSLSITTGRLIGSGTISADGGDCISGRGGSGGGGRVVLSANSTAGSGIISAKGGSGGNGGSGGQVSGYVPGTTTWAWSADGGAGGSAGTVSLSASPLLSWIDPQDNLFHGTHPLKWVGLGVDPQQLPRR